MKKRDLIEYSQKARDIIKFHLSMIGKPNDDVLINTILDTLVRKNPQFQLNFDIEDTLESFINAIHYGSFELKTLTLSSHARALNYFMQDRFKARSYSDDIGDNSGKPENWVYNPSEPLPPDIDKKKAKELLMTIAKIYGSDLSKMANGEKWVPYIEKLKNRYYNGL